MPERHELIKQLFAMPEAIDQAERAVFEWQVRLVDKRRELARREDSLLLQGREGPVTGGNEALRAAQLRGELWEWYRAVEDLENRRGAASPGFAALLRSAQLQLDAWRRRLRLAQNQFAALRAVARLIGAEEKLP